MVKKARISARAEDYLKTLFLVTEEHGKATSKLVCAEMGVSPGSATSMFKKLASRGLLDYTRYGEVRLTGQGEKKALEMVRHHRLLETFLRKVLNYSLDLVHDEADELEHS